MNGEPPEVTVVKTEVPSPRFAAFYKKLPPTFRNFGSFPFIDSSIGYPPSQADASEISKHYQKVHEIMKDDSPATYDRYWGLHTDDYLQRLDRLRSGIGPEFVHEGTRATVVLASMNEIDIVRAIDALRRSYGEGFENEVSVLIYNNYRSAEPDPEAMAALEPLRAARNIAVVDEQVPDYSNVCTAKKTASDIAMRYMTSIGKRVPIVFTDADILDLTKNSIQDAIELIAPDDSPILAATTEFDFDPEAKKKFPNWGFVDDFRLHLGYSPEVRNEARNLLGPFMAIQPSVLASVGGLNPEASHEDIELGQKLRAASGYSLHRIDPVYSLGNKRGEGRVVVDPSRQIENLLNRSDADAHWQSKGKQLHDTISGTRRINWRDVPNDDSIPGLMATFDPFEANIMLNNWWRQQNVWMRHTDVERKAKGVARFFLERHIPVQFVCQKGNSDQEVTGAGLERRNGSIEVDHITPQEILDADSNITYYIRTIFMDEAVAEAKQREQAP